MNGTVGKQMLKIYIEIKKLQNEKKQTHLIVIQECLKSEYKFKNLYLSTSNISCNDVLAFG